MILKCSNVMFRDRHVTRLKHLPLWNIGYLMVARQLHMCPTSQFEAHLHRALCPCEVQGRNLSLDHQRGQGNYNSNSTNDYRCV
jgi:hypothetical protein